jgi:cytosine/adenosine deaminase-related metal-dependent hydrolase
MSVSQAFLLATRAGGLALRRPDLGVIQKGATADLCFFDGNSPSLLGWHDPVAAVILHANVGDISDVVVNGEFLKRDGKITAPEYKTVKKRFLKSARKIQEVWTGIGDPKLRLGEDKFFGFLEYGAVQKVVSERKE